MSLRSTPVSFAFATVAALVLELVLGSMARAQSNRGSAPVRILILRPAEGPVPDGFDELVGALRVMVGTPIAVDVVRASVPPTSTDDAARRWGGSVARSEGATGVIWLEPGTVGDRSVLWVVRLEGQQQTAERLELSEPRTFDRMRALALAARPLLGPLIARVANDPTGDEEASDQPATADAEPERGGEDGAGTATATATATEGTPPHGGGAPEGSAAPTDGAATPVEPRPLAPAQTMIRTRLALGATLRNDAILGARLIGELTFRERGWAHISGELLRTDQLADGSERQRAQTMAFAGAAIGRGRVRAKVGAGLGVALSWPEGQTMASGFVLAAMGALTVELGPELFLSIPLTLEGVLARPEGEAIPGWQGSFGVLVGIAP